MIHTMLRRLLMASGALLGAVITDVAHAQNSNPCALLTADEVEAVIGGPLAGPPFRSSGGVADAGGDTCRFETAELRAIDLRVEWTDGGTSFGVMNMVGGIVSEAGMKGVLKLSEGTALAGEWDAARVFMCCEFDALLGETLVVVDVSASRASIEDAAKLVNTALLRLDEPLSVEDSAGIAEAEERTKLRPAARSVCELLTRAEAEAIVGAPLLADPEGDENSCSYSWNLADAGYEFQVGLVVTWRGGFSEMRFAQAAIGQAVSFLETEGMTMSEELQADPLDEEAVTFIGVMVAERDVLLSIETGGMMNDVALALVRKAAGNL